MALDPMMMQLLALMGPQALMAQTPNPHPPVFTPQGQPGMPPGLAPPTASPSPMTPFVPGATPPQPNMPPPPDQALPMIQAAINDPEGTANQAAAAGMEPPPIPPSSGRLGATLAATPEDFISQLPSNEPDFAQSTPPVAPGAQERPISPLEALQPFAANTPPPPGASRPGLGGPAGANPQLLQMLLAAQGGGQGGGQDIPSLGQILAQFMGR